MKTFLLTGAFWAFFATLAQAQVGINTDNSPPDPSAMLDVKSTTRGTLLTRMTMAELSAISAPANGLQVFCTTDSKMYIYAAVFGQWKEVAYGPGIILPPFACGIPVTISHIAGAVAPVNKTVTYSTVGNIPGEPAKCWITSNLGADRQALSVNDATEPSAGWYWQFNRKQGYRHTGTAITPVTTWITSISENADWTVVNDPCTIELGSAWRIPTSTEWGNVDNGGGWTSWIGPWNSGLKMHLAGYLSPSSGGLINRGIDGLYSASNSYDVSNGWYLIISSTAVNTYHGNKATARTLRCLRN